MDPVPYEIRAEDVDEVLSAWESVGGSWTREERAAAHDHVMSQVLDIDEIVRTAPEERRLMPRAGEMSGKVGDDSPRRDMALAAIEDVLIRDGFIDTTSSEERVFPISDRAD
jgi:hypothetical protein